jgi:hypothetical protein
VVFCFIKPEDADAFRKRVRWRGDQHDNEALIAVRRP